MKKPQIDYNKDLQAFESYGLFLSNDQAREYWEDIGSADWTQSAHERMSNIVMSDPPTSQRTFTEQQIVEAINSFRNVDDWKSSYILSELKKKLGITS